MFYSLFDHLPPLLFLTDLPNVATKYSPFLAWDCGQFHLLNPSNAPLGTSHALAAASPKESGLARVAKVTWRHQYGRLRDRIAR